MNFEKQTGFKKKLNFQTLKLGKKLLKKRKIKLLEKIVKIFYVKN